MEKSRVRLSSIDLLPAEAEPDVQWAIEELEAGNRLQIDVHKEFNARLADRGIGPISHSAFSRYALRKRRAFARLREVREISATLTKSLDAAADDDVTITVAQVIKTLVFELLEGGKAVSPKGAMELARALHATVAAQKISSDRRKKIEAHLADKVEETVEEVAKAAGLSKERAAEIRNKVLGLRT